MIIGFEMRKKYFIIISTAILFVSISFLSGCLYEIPEDPNTFVRSIIHDGYNRTYRIHIPPNLTQVESPSIVFILHGGGGTGENTERTLTLGGFNTLSDEHKFLVIYPDGIDRHWNDGRIVNDTAHQQNIDDVQNSSKPVYFRQSFYTFKCIQLCHISYFFFFICNCCNLMAYSGASLNSLYII